MHVYVCIFHYHWCIQCFRSTAVVHHYMIPSQRVPVTVLYPSLPFNTNHPPTTNDSLVNDREKLHKLFCLPRNRPFFRLDNLHWPCNHDRYLINPHAGLHSLSATGTLHIHYQQSIMY